MAYLERRSKCKYKPIISRTCDNAKGKSITSLVNKYLMTETDSVMPDAQ